MKERPIIFSGPMVRAILAGRKTQTRRVIKPQPLSRTQFYQQCWDPYSRDLFYYPAEHRTPPETKNSTVDEIASVGEHVRCPYGKPGDRLWVRETHRFAHHPELWDVVEYRADEAIRKPTGLDNNTGYQFSQLCDMNNGKWRPPVHTPRWASRILLEVTEVRVERVQDISTEDAIAEAACEALENDFAATHLNAYPKEAFQALWDSLNGKRGYGWDKNPWVWCVSFKLTQ